MSAQPPVSANAADGSHGDRKPRLRFPKPARLAASAEFAKVRTEGRPVHGKMLTLGLLKEAHGGCARIGIITSRRVGAATVRSTVRRRLRDIVRLARPRLLPGIWMVIVAKTPAARASYAALSAEWAQLARRGGVLAE